MSRPIRVSAQNEEKLDEALEYLTVVAQDNGISRTDLIGRILNYFCKNATDEFLIDVLLQNNSDVRSHNL